MASSLLMLHGQEDMALMDKKKWIGDSSSPFLYMSINYPSEEYDQELLESSGQFSALFLPGKKSD